MELFLIKIGMYLMNKIWKGLSRIKNRAGKYYIKLWHIKAKKEGRE